MAGGEEGRESGARSQKIGSKQEAGKAGIDDGDWQTSPGLVFSTDHGRLTTDNELVEQTSRLELPLSIFQFRISSLYFGVSTCTRAPRRRRAARTVFDINIAMVNGPTPPGTGV